MLDLGFLEDVEKILSLTPGRPPDGAVQRDDAARDPRAGRPPPLRPGDGQGQGGDADHRHGRAVLRRGQARATRTTRSCACSRPSGPTQAIVFVRTKIRCEQLYRTLRDKGMNVKALHGDMSQGSRDGVMISLQGRARADPRRHRRRRPRARHLVASPTSSTSTSRPRPTSTCTASGAPAASAARAARSRSSSRARSASSRRSRSTPTRRSRRGRRARTSSPTPGVGAARAATRKPHDARDGQRRRLREADRLRRPRRRAVEAPT